MTEGTRHTAEPARSLERETPAVAVVRKAFEAFAHRDLAALVKLTDPQVELFAPTAVIANEGRCYRGHDGIARYLQDVAHVWKRLEVIPEKFREVGSHVVATGRVRAEARDGLEIDSSAAWVWELRNGLLCWGCVYDESSSSPGEATPGPTPRAAGTTGDDAPPAVGAASGDDVAPALGGA
jgi:ketosteroid isomerase-like protein